MGGGWAQHGILSEPNWRVWSEAASVKDIHGCCENHYNRLATTYRTEAAGRLLAGSKQVDEVSGGSLLPRGHFWDAESLLRLACGNKYTVARL